METKVVVSSKREIAAIEALTILQFHIASCVSRKEMFTVGKIFQPTPGLKKRSSTLDKLHSYPFIPLRPDIILSELIFAIELLTGKFGRDSWTKAPKFLDAGCGPGNIILLAGACGYFDLQRLREVRRSLLLLSNKWPKTNELRRTCRGHDESWSNSASASKEK